MFRLPSHERTREAFYFLAGFLGKAGVSCALASFATVIQSK
jgi:hypothetical protein